MAHEPAAFRQHPMWRGATVFAIGAGVVIVLAWAWRYFSGVLATELAASPFATWARLFAEFATAIALFVAGYGLITGAAWARRCYLVATGMLLFAGVAALGQYADSGQLGIVVLYLAVGVFAIFYAIRVEE
jgi:hypothetical protein